MRKLTIIRKKAFASCLDKTWFYIEDANGDEEISCVRCRLLCTLKNGKSFTCEIGEEPLRLLAVSGDFKGIYSEHGFALEVYQINGGTEDITVSGKRKLDIAHANSFVFD